MTGQKRYRAGCRLAAVVLWAGLTSACGSLSLSPPVVPELKQLPVPPVADIDPLRTTPEIREFVELHATGERKPGGRAWALAYASLDPFLLDFDYDPMITLPADQAFAARRGNCLTFSSLFIAMAREAGLQAWYQEVEVPPVWNAVNDTLLVGMHVNAVIQDRGRAYTVDVSRRERQPLEQTRRLTDAEAQSHYYNNLGVDALLDRDLGLAYAYFRKALENDRRQPYVWSNLGVVFKRNGQSGDAVLAYRTALALDPQQTVAANNLFSFYEETGETEAAAELRRQVERNRRDNPYYLLHLAEEANEERRFADAIRLLNRAIEIEHRDYRFHYTLARSQYLAGDLQSAQRSLERARQLAPANPGDAPLTLP
jgi:Flp pilus assembly protein TadD